MQEYVIILDQGTTSTRAIIFDKHGNIVAKKQMEFSQICKNNGWVEHNAEEIWETTLQVIKEVIKISKLNINCIKGISITNQRETTVLWNKETGKPVYNAIVWQSRQSLDICDKWIELGYENIVHQKTGLRINPYFSASKIKWIFDNVNGVKQLSDNNKLLFGTIDTYLVWKLTNGKKHITDVSNASRTMIYNINTLNWDNELLNMFEIPKNILPKVVDNMEIIGKTNLFFNHEFDIITVLGDQQASLFGQCCFNSGDIKATYGTGAFILMNTSEKLIMSKDGLLTTVAWQINGKATYALEGSVFVAGAAVQWLRDEMQFFNTSSQSEDLLKSDNPSNGVYFVPAFVGLGTPYWDSDARGAIYGLTRASSIENIVAATLESIAFQVNDVMEVMKKNSNLNINYLGVDGGASKNNYLMQFQANISNQKLIRPTIFESTAKGIAYLSFMSLGIIKSFDEISDNHSIDNIFVANIDEKFRNEKKLQWKKAINATIKFK